jgi:hypothetical protein
MVRMSERGRGIFILMSLSPSLPFSVSPFPLASVDAVDMIGCNDVRLNPKLFASAPL